MGRLKNELRDAQARVKKRIPHRQLRDFQEGTLDSRRWTRPKSICRIRGNCILETATAPDGAASSGAVAFREGFSTAARYQKAQTTWSRQVAHLPLKKAVLSAVSAIASKLAVDSAECAGNVRNMNAKAIAIAEAVFIGLYFRLLSCLMANQLA